MTVIPPGLVMRPCSLKPAVTTTSSSGEKVLCAKTVNGKLQPKTNSDTNVLSLKRRYGLVLLKVDLLMLEIRSVSRVDIPIEFSVPSPVLTGSGSKG